MRNTAKPRLVVISGMPGSGKSTLARTLANTVDLPVLSRDEIYAGLFQTCKGERSQPHDLAQTANTALRECARLLLNAGVPVIIEAAFQQKLWQVVLESLLPLADVRVVRCVIEPELALQRMVRRLDQFPEQRAAHHDAQYIRERIGQTTPWPHFDAISLGVPTMDVETADGYLPSLETVASFVSTQRFSLTMGGCPDQ